MIKNRTNFRVRYAETDQMGYVYYGNYAAYFEVGRVELMRDLGTSYRAIEESGVMLPVRDFKTRYFKPAFYDQEIVLETRLEQMPNARITFHYSLFDTDEVLLTTAEITLVFVDMKTNRPVQIPEWFGAKLAPYFG
jgi:acyl-CoA thioester hydrolase